MVLTSPLEMPMELLKFGLRYQVQSKKCATFWKIWICNLNFFIFRTVATFCSNPPNSSKAVTALDWILKNERYFIHGDNNGLIQLHDTRDCKTLWELQHERSRIVSLLSNPAESTFVCSVSDSREGKLLLYDIKTRKLERSLPMDPNLTALCSTFNHNGQLLITGLSNGNVLIHDLRRNEIIDNFNCHSSPVKKLKLGTLNFVIIHWNSLIKIKNCLGHRYWTCKWLYKHLYSKWRWPIMLKEP